MDFNEFILMFWNEFESVRNVWSENKNYHKYQISENQLNEDTNKGRERESYEELLYRLAWKVFIIFAY